MRLTIDDVYLKKPHSVLGFDLTWDQAMTLHSTFACPVLGNVFGILHNDARGLDALGEAMNQDPYKAPPSAPVLYTKPRNTLLPNGATIVAPKGLSQLQMGAALGIVMGDVATRLTLSNAMSKIAGYTVVNDVSVAHESFYRPSLRFKTFDTSCVIGPWVRGVMHVSQPDALMVRTWVNNQLVQEYSTAIFTRNVAQLLVDVTEFMTLQQGDVIMLGVAHPPVLAQIGDKVQIDIEHVGRLNSTVGGSL